MSSTTSLREVVASHPRLLSALVSASVLLSTVVGTAAAGGSTITVGP